RLIPFLLFSVFIFSWKSMWKGQKRQSGNNAKKLSPNPDPMKKYFNDPRPLTVRYQANCAECGTILKKGTFAYYWPSDGKLYCQACGESEFRQFLSAAADEAVYQGIGNPFAY
ncbi:MAG: hypothetical protein WCR42_16330, partial [bacterium]